MKKLLLIPTVLMTVLLAISFLMPARAAMVLQSVAPAAHISFPSVLVARSGNQAASTTSGTTGSAGSSALLRGLSSSAGSSSSAGASTLLMGETGEVVLSTQGGGHTVSTPSRDNCGRFGDGSHGGKHDFTCPNRPFPAPASAF